MLNKNNKKIAAIIPAYNEEKNVGAVLKIIKDADFLDQVLIVDDGSTDNTTSVVREAGFEVLSLNKNQGKGAALQAGFKKIDADIYLLIDSDLIGLSVVHLIDLISPLIEDESLAMTVGKFRGGRKRTDWAQKIIPTISGQRAMTKKLVKNLPDLSKEGFGVEVALTKFARDNSYKDKEVILENITQVMKEEKIGFIKGFSHRMKMYGDMLKTYWKRG